MGSVTDVSHCTICSMSSDHEDMDLDLDLRVGDLYLDLDLNANDLDLDSDLRSEDLTTTLILTILGPQSVRVLSDCCSKFATFSYTLSALTIPSLL
jgi:hypothetical protein